MKGKIARVLHCFEQAGLVVMDKESYDRLVNAVDSQAEEIEALDKRIKRLLER
ncbi:hypothetical protein [Geomonas propionica]|uniref:Uncharacterized protein n=1 Tax=Geomonas propionica TaxID=2798582 RepID=A0ABS0YRQ6_9BACT|nr:hypothetical protein [Geomonas propionica]MBJ6800210.1 hypothetical protein [Geomonas propionica]